MTGQHLLLLLWTLWLVFALLSIGDLLGVILALVFGLLGLGLILTGLASWRGYVIAWLTVHVLVAAFRIAVLRGWLPVARASRQDGLPTTAPSTSGPPSPQPATVRRRPGPESAAAAEHQMQASSAAEVQSETQAPPVSVRRRLPQTLSDWTQNWALQTMSGSVSLVGLISLLFLRPTVPWMYRADIPIMLLVAFAVVAAEYALFGDSLPFGRASHPKPAPDLATNATNTVEGVVVQPEQLRPPDVEVANSERIEALARRIWLVSPYISSFGNGCVTRYTSSVNRCDLCQIFNP